MTGPEQQTYDLTGLTLPISKKGTGCPFDPKIIQHALDVDRRKCRRVVPMKVLVLGLSRTGTVSLRHALFELDYFDVYHGSSFCNENPRDCEMWTEALRGRFEGGKRFERSDWDQLFGHCMAISDAPSYAFADDLIKAYPEAKVILTVRDSPEAWRKSMMSTVIPTALAHEEIGVVGRILMAFAPKTYYQPMFGMVIKYTRLLDVPSRGVRMYEEHNNWIRSLVPKENLLEFNVKQGWEPLCRFLGKEVPPKPFPHVNGSRDYLETLGSFQKKTGADALTNMAIYLGIPLVVAACWAAYTRQVGSRSLVPLTLLQAEWIVGRLWGGKR
ncbi:uncharacterized protein Z518_06960 [Rhinocladiella mackenziei CBS 650.93]|uniref:NAD dependent epimerase/dehydratase n=1 Tax=Rhinocladiella mackenziei CBS 650.93 TaxID=1442369 RepID=A0A0D2GZ17_9EURO|nr:uncharacterized protein Z518_06960 [Rhinocladiella mackenziei CBS 650.93]KIX03408.1 hypothetical protein Z518_06960 [Rhinocladiella mackenziei CBS 650.93]